VLALKQSKIIEVIKPFLKESWFLYAIQEKLFKAKKKSKRGF